MNSQLRPARPSLLRTLDELRALPSGLTGGCVYFLWNENDLLYVGSSGAASWRISQHIRQKVIPFTRATMLDCEPMHMRYLERSYIRLFKPPYNKMGNPDWMEQAERPPGRPLMGPSPHLSTRDEFEIWQNREAGIPIKDCARMSGVSVATVMRIMAKLRRKFGRFETLPNKQKARAHLTHRIAQVDE